MRLHRLELEGFGPFRERQVVDFDAFACDGIFLISGRTGAGKSSILDGVSFALYGAVPRYDTGDKRLRSDHCEPDDPTEVRLDFTVGDRRWRVTRAPEYQRPSRRGGGFTSEPTRAELEELVDGEWIGRAAKPRDVGLLLDEVLALNAQQFQQVILLAQNKFSRFLLASGAERQSLLRALFGTRRYEEYTRELAERGKAAQRELDAIEARARTLLDQAERLIDAHRLTDDAVAEAPADLAARRARVELAEQRAAYRLDTLQRERIHADAAREAAEAAHATRVAFAKAQTELADARARLDALEKQSETVAADRAVLERGRAAEALRSSLDAARRSEEALRTAAELAAQAQHVWVERASASGMDEDADLDAVVEDLTGELAVWATAASQEAELPAREAELQSAERRLAELRTDLAALDEQRAEIPAELTRLEAAIDDAREAAALLDPARTRLAETESRLAAAREAEALTPALHAAEAAHRDAAAAAATAATAVAALLQRRLDGYAGELAATLVDGEPCAVCGSTAHPHPAPTAPEPVTDEMLGAAESERDGAIVRERTAAEAARAARERHAEALTRAGGAGSDALEELRVAVAAEVAAARAAAERRDAHVAARTELLTLSAAAEAARADLVSSIGDHSSRIAALEGAVDAMRAAVAQARGDFATVADRVAAATGVRDAARSCAAARADETRAAQTRDAAVSELHERLAASVFDDAQSAHAALLAPNALQALAERIAAHDAQLAATRNRVLELELELAGTDDEAVDVAASRAALDAADAARTAALGAERDAQGLAASLRDLVQQIDDASANVAERAADAAAIARLADTVAGRAPNTMKMDLETFVLAAELEEIVDAANTRLGDMSAGRYRLQHTDARAARGAASGLGLEVVDAYTGQARPAQSLSGGETFLASLALALGLAEVVTARAGGVRLDTLFIDEGFGSLDEETLDLAMRTLDELRQGGRTVGVISHVAAMKEQLPAQLTVESRPHGPSVILQPAAVTA